jgi:phage terminase small subunit
MTRKGPPDPPAHLSQVAAKFWRDITERYLLEAHELQLLCFACEALDAREVARLAIAKDGAFVKGQRGHLVAHPGVKTMKDSTETFRQILGRLDLKGAR